MPVQLLKHALQILHNINSSSQSSISQYLSCVQRPPPPPAPSAPAPAPDSAAADPAADPVLAPAPAAAEQPTLVPAPAAAQPVLKQKRSLLEAAACGGSDAGACPPPEITYVNYFSRLRCATL